MNTQASSMLQPAAASRNAPSTTPNFAAERRGLVRSRDSDPTLCPTTNWVPPSDRPSFIIINGNSVEKVGLVI